MPIPIETLYQSDFDLYAIIFYLGTMAWNTVTKAFETYDPGHWADYAVPLPELTGSGYYAGTYPAEIAAAIGSAQTSEAFFVRGGVDPTLGDVPAAGLAHTQGANVAQVGGSGVAAGRLKNGILSEAAGLVVAGAVGANTVPTDVTGLAVDAVVGRSLVFYAGTAAKSAARVIAYAADGTFTVAAPWAVVPDAGDAFLIL